LSKHQENRIAIALKAAGYDFEREHRFHPKRKWRLDFAIKPLHQKIAIEFEGGVFLPKARHTSMIGYSNDVEKYREAVLLGWKILRYTAKELSKKNGEYIIVEDLQRLLQSV